MPITLRTLIFPGDGLALNPGAEDSIQNTSCGELNKIPQVLERQFGGVPIPIFETLIANPNIFRSEGQFDEGLIDVSNVSSVSLMVEGNITPLTSVDITLKFYDSSNLSPAPWELATFDSAVVVNDVVYTVRRVVFRYAVSGEIYVFAVPVPNAKFMQVWYKGNGASPGADFQLSVSRGYNIGSGFRSV